MNVKAVIFFFARSDDTIILSKYSLTIHVCAKKIAILIRDWPSSAADTHY